MKNAIRCCISCILPCGALDVIRIVHTNGHVEEISKTVKASEIMKLYPKHVLKKPSSPTSSSNNDSCTPHIVTVDPETELKRGKIYFLMPLPAVHHEKRSEKKKKARDRSSNHEKSAEGSINYLNSCIADNLAVCDRYLSEIMTENKDRSRRGRVGVWRPHLESISEMPLLD